MDAGGQRTTLGIALGLGLLAAVLFWPATGYEFLNLDDDRYVTRNPHLEAGLGVDGVAWALTTDHEGVWIPATWVSLLADRQLFGPDPSGFHRTNVLLHAANVVLLFLLLRVWTGTRWRAAFVAALFAVHPLNVEPVAWVTGRKDVLFVFFGLAALLAWLRWSRGGRPAWYAGALALAALALMAKPMAVILPVLMIILVKWPRPAGDPAPSWARIAISLAPFVLLATAVAVVARQAAVSGEWGAPEAVPLVDRVGRAAVFAVTYLARLLWPAGLCLQYPVETMVFGWPARLGAAGLIGGVTLGAWWARYRTGWFMSGWAWFAAGLLPVLDLVQGGQQLLSDRYVYLPGVGIFLAAAFFLEWLGRRVWMPRPIPVVLAGAVLVALGWAAVVQLPHWRDNETAYERALAVTPDNHRANLNLATHLDETGRTGEALQHARRAVAIRESATGYYNLGNILLRLERPGQARRAYEDALRIDPDLPEAHSNLGLIAANDSRPVDAEEHFRRALALDPDLVVARFNLAQILAILDRRDEALVELRTVLARDPAYPGARDLLRVLQTSR